MPKSLNTKLVFAYAGIISLIMLFFFFNVVGPLVKDATVISAIWYGSVALTAVSALGVCLNFNNIVGLCWLFLLAAKVIAWIYVLNL